MKTKKANNVTGVATIFTRCPDCGKLLKVSVNFRKRNKGFTTTNHTCEFCGCEMTVKDCHKYDKNGFVVD